MGVDQAAKNVDNAAVVADCMNSQQDSHEKSKGKDKVKEKRATFYYYGSQITLSHILLFRKLEPQAMKDNDLPLKEGVLLTTRDPLKSGVPELMCGAQFDMCLKLKLPRASIHPVPGKGDEGLYYSQSSIEDIDQHISEIRLVGGNASEWANKLRSVFNTDSKCYVISCKTGMFTADDGTPTAAWQQDGEKVQVGKVTDERAQMQEAFQEMEKTFQTIADRVSTLDGQESLTKSNVPDLNFDSGSEPVSEGSSDTEDEGETAITTAITAISNTSGTGNGIRQRRVKSPQRTGTSSDSDKNISTSSTSSSLTSSSSTASSTSSSTTSSSCNSTTSTTTNSTTEQDTKKSMSMIEWALDLINKMCINIGHAVDAVATATVEAAKTAGRAISDAAVNGYDCAKAGVVYCIDGAVKGREKVYTCAASGAKATWKTVCDACTWLTNFVKRTPQMTVAMARACSSQLQSMFSIIKGLFV